MILAEILEILSTIKGAADAINGIMGEDEDFEGPTGVEQWDMIISESTAEITDEKEQQIAQVIEQIKI